MTEIDHIKNQLAMARIAIEQGDLADAEVVLGNALAAVRRERARRTPTRAESGQGEREDG